MGGYKSLTLMLSLCVLLTPQVQAQTDANSNVEKKADAPTIIVTSLEIDEKALDMTYEIINNTEEDIWILTARYPDYSPSRMCGGLYWAPDGILTFGSLISIRSDFFSYPTYGKFVRLGSGQSQTESIYIKMPVNSAPRSGSEDQQDKDYQYATKLAIQYSYYSGNLPEMNFRMAEEREKNRPADSPDYNLSYIFSSENEFLSSREDELFIRWGGLDPRIAREKVLRKVVDNVRIPYKKMSEYQAEYERPKLGHSTEVEITYHPSMLEYFFPFAFQQNLMNSEEIEYLQSRKPLVLKGTKKIMTFAYDVGGAHTKFPVAGTLSERYRSYVEVVCHYDDKPQISFFIYNNDIRFDDGLFPCREGFPSLKMLTPRIQELGLRMRCAANLKNLWSRFRIHHFY